MEVVNQTDLPVESLLEEAVADYDHDGLRVEIKYCRTDSNRSISGTYYHAAPGRPQGRLIRLRINRANTYPVQMFFKKSEYFIKDDGRGRQVICQRLRARNMATPQHLLLAVFLHEFSHYLDHIEGRNGRYKQTKADKFSYERLISMGILPPED